MAQIVSKFLRIAQAGTTADGRKITTKQIDQMAANYSPDKFGARIWLEHLRSLFADGMFPAFGDVLALKATDVDGKRTLMAQLSPTDTLLEMNKNRQKVFTSIEMNPNFADSGEAYLTGLALTDSPASLGTEMLKFSMQHKKEFAHADKLPNSIFSDSLETAFVLEDEKSGKKHKPSLFAKVKALFDKNQDNVETHFADVDSAVMEIAKAQDKLDTRVGTYKARLADLKTANKELSTKVLDLQTFKTQVEKESPFNPRPASTGGDGRVKAKF